MTQQFELAFNTTSNMDKMMTNTQTSSNKSYSSSDNKFGDYLNNANKTYTDNSKTNECSKKQTVSDRKDTTKTNDYNKNNSVKSETKTECLDEKQIVYNEENSTQADSKEVSINVSEIKDETNNVAQAVVEQEVEQVVDEQEMQDVLKDSIINANLSNTQPVSKEDVAKLEKTLTLEMADDNELPVEAVKSGISFENLNTDLAEDADLSNVDMSVLDNATDVKQLSQEEVISAMYNSKTTEKAETLADTVDVKVVKQEETVDLKADNTPKVVIADDEVKIDAKDVNVEIKDDVKVALTDTKDVKDEVKIDVKDKVKIDVKEVRLEEKDAKVQDSKEEVVAEVKDSDKKDLKIEMVDENELSIEDLKAQFLNDVDTTVSANEIVQNQPQQKQQQEVVTDKVQTLKEEIQSAKQENIYETISSQDDKRVEDKKVDDKFAKTNVKADETMDIKDDVKGIEFVSKKSDDKVVDEKVATNIKEKVENVKIQVEDNVKVVNNSQNVQDSEKIAKANETMNKAGLTTKTLQEMDGKITDIEDAQTGANFGGTSSQEMMMRDMLTENATSVSADAKTTVDFVQSLNKTTNAQQTPQMQQNIQEAPEVDILDQIRAKFAVNSKNGLQKITIGLTPESLGKVSVEIVKGQNGISAQILADNAQAKELLDKNLDGLKSVLQSQGVNVNNVNVKIAEAGRSSDSNNNMFQNEDGQFDSNQGNGNSRNSDESNHGKHTDFEFVQNNAMMQEPSDEPEDILTRTAQAEKTVSIKAGLGNVNYKL